MTATPPVIPGRLAIRLLGGFRVTVGDRPVDDRAWRLKRATQLVKMLALAPSHRLHRDQLIDQLWPDADGDWAAASFHQALHAARNALEPERPARRSHSFLSLQRQVLILAPEVDCWIDSEAFAEAAAGARASHDVADSLAALALYAGDLLPEDLYESWTAADREQLRQTYLSLLFTTAQRQAAAGLVTDAIGNLYTLVGEDSLNEAAYVALIRLEALSGRREHALRHYHQLQETLETELAAKPSPEAVELYRRIAAGEFATPLAVPDPVVPVPAQPARAPAAAPVPGNLVSLVDRARADGLVARGTELTCLQAAFEAMLAGKGQIVLLTGEPGIGKTRLAEVLAEYALARGATALWAYGHEAPDVPAFWFWAQLVRASSREWPTDEVRENLGVGAGPIAQVVPELFQLLPDLPEPVTLDPAQARYRFFDSMTAYIEQLSRRMPLVLLLDDLQWADQASIALLEFMADLIADQRILMLGTLRIADVQGNPQLLQTIERLGRIRSAQRLDLQGLDPEETARFGELVGGQILPAEVTASVYARTDGNPLFVRELVRLLVADDRYTVEGDPPGMPGRWGSSVPLSVRQAVGLRLRQLADEAQRLLRIAAVIGSPFALDVLTATADVPLDAMLDQLEEAMLLGVVRADPDDVNQFRFSHALIQEAVAEGLLSPRRARLHGRIGEVLEELAGSRRDPPLAEIAYHYTQAAAMGKAREAIHYLTLAGEQSLTRLDYALAASQLQQAVELLAQLPGEHRVELVDLLVSLGRAQVAAGVPETAHASLLRAVELARQLNDAEREVNAAIELVQASLRLATERGGETIYVLRQTLDNLPPEDSLPRARVLSTLAMLLENVGFTIGLDPGIPEPLAVAQQAMAMARRLGDPVASFYAIGAFQEVHSAFEDIEQNLQDLIEMVHLSTQIGGPQQALRARNALFTVLLQMGRSGEADQELEAIATIATAHRLRADILKAETRFALRAFMRGNLDEAEAIVERARRASEIIYPDGSPLAYPVEAIFLQRERDEPTESAEESLKAVGLTSSFIFPDCIQALLRAESGATNQAAAIVSRVADVGINASPRQVLWLAAMALLAETCATLNDRVNGDRLLPVLRPYHNIFPAPGGAGIFLEPIAHSLGRLAQTLERSDEAAAYFEDALRLEELAGTPILRVHTQCAYAELLAHQLGRLEDAQRLLDSAGATAERLKLPRASRIVRDMKAALSACRSP